jgi:hypothetical protein
MRINKKYFFQIGNKMQPIQVKEYVVTIGRIIVQNVLLLGFVFLISMPLPKEALAFEQPNIENYENLDTRWLPWIGSWRLVSEAEATMDSTLKDQYLLTVSLGDSEKSIIMKGYRDEQVLFEEKIETDGLRRPMEKDDCTGWQSCAWSETGKRLLFSGESSCSSDLSQQVSGMSFIDDAGDWLDIQLLQSEEEKAITIRRYRNVDADTIPPGGTSIDSARIARLTAGTGFSIDEIIELSGKVDPEVLEAALVEMHKPFPINSKQLIRLADAKVSTRIIDLMVALSFPDKFIVEQTIISRVQEPVFQPEPSHLHRPHHCWACACPTYPWYWATSIYPWYDYWYLDRYYWPGWYYDAWWHPSYGGGYGFKTGTLVKGHGYTRVYSESSAPPQPRYARPRNAATAQGARSFQPTGSSTATPSSTSSSRSSNVSTAVPRSNSPSASPSGYSSGSSSSSSTEEPDNY